MAGAILTTSIETSMLASLLIAMDRLICIVILPYQKYGLSRKAIYVNITLSWIFSIVTSIMAPIFTDRVKNAACIYLGKSLPSVPSALYLGFNAIIFIFLSAIYICTLCYSAKSAMPQMPGKNTSFIRQLSIRLGAIIITNYISCAVISALAIISFVNSNLYSHTEVLVGLILFPVNAIANPLISTIFSTKFIDSLSAKKTCLVK
jgi:hypothetical protein